MSSSTQHCTWPWLRSGGLRARWAPNEGTPTQGNREARASSGHTGSSQTQAEPTELKKDIQGGGQKRPLRITLSVGTAGPGHKASCLRCHAEGRKDTLGGVGGAAPHQPGKKGRFPLPRSLRFGERCSLPDNPVTWVLG